MFQPRHLATVNIDVSTSNQRVAIPGVRPCAVRVMNNGSATAWIEFGDSSVVASASTCMPIGPGLSEIVIASPVMPVAGDLYVAAIAAGSTGKIYFTPGSNV